MLATVLIALAAALFGLLIGALMCAAGNASRREDEEALVTARTFLERLIAAEQMDPREAVGFGEQRSSQTESGDGIPDKRD